MPTDKETSSPLLKTLSVERMKRLMLIDEFLSRRGREQHPATIAEICSYLKISDDNQKRGIRKNIDSLCELSDDENSHFKIIKTDEKPVRYMIAPGHSLFHRNFNDLFERDLNNTEKKLLMDIFKTMGSFDIPGMRNINDLAKEANSGISKELSERRCIDLGIKSPDRKHKTLLSGLFEAIASHKVIRLFYKPMNKLSDNSVETSSILFCPWQLKLFGDRWGLIGMAKSDGFILKFYLEQIESFEEEGTTYREAEMQRIDRLFDNLVGMSTPRHLCMRNPEPAMIEEPQDIYVWVDPLRVQYLRSFPLHYSMDELDEDWDITRELRKKFPGLPEGGAIFQMNVYVTYSLKQLLISYFDRMVVLEPESLRLDIEDRISRMMNLYEALSSGKHRKNT